MLTTIPSWLAAARRVLIVAPHPDDDVIGCGGTMFDFTRRGIQPSILYVTDGSASHPNSLDFPRARLVGLRECEARAALAELGVSTEPIFLRERDGTLTDLDTNRFDQLAARIGEALSSLEIDTVLGPLPHDPHPDHIATARALREARSSRPPMVRIVHYAVWTSIRSGPDGTSMLPPRDTLQLDAGQVDAKRRALSCHRTQTTAMIDDDPTGFRIDEALMNEWLRPVESFYAAAGS